MTNAAPRSGFFDDAAPLGAPLAGECGRRLGCRVKQGYGMTELGGATHVVPDAGGGPASSIGPLLPGAEARVVDCASGLDVGLGRPGEMLIRTPGAMRGYHRNAEATAATIDVSSASGEATLVYQVDRTAGIVTVSSIDITTSTGLATLSTALATGVPVKVFGVPQSNALMAYVLVYFTGVLPIQ